MKTTCHKKTAIASAISAALLMSSPTIYIAAEENNANEETIIVTATRRSMSVEEVPFNISAISGAAIEEAGIVDSQELLRELPGIMVPDNGARLSENNNSITIRGLNVNPYATDRAFLSDPTVSTYVGDTPVFANFILRDIARVEVLRGPQGTLYGSGSLGGTVRYILNSPDTSEFEGRVDMSYGTTDGSNGNNLSYDAMVNLPISDSVAFRFSAGKIDNDGVIDYVNVYETDASGVPIAEGGDLVYGGPVYKNVKDADTVDMTYTRAAILFEPTDDFSAVLTHMTQEGEYGGRRQETSGPDGWGEYYDDHEIGAVILEPAENESESTSLEIEYDLGFATLSSSTSVYERSYIGTSDNTGFFASQGWLYWYGYGAFPRPAYSADRQNHEEAFVQEFRLASNSTDSDFDWVVGAFYMDQESSAAQQTHVLGFQEFRNAAEPIFPDYYFDWYDPSTNVSFDWTNERDYSDKAFFGEFTYHMSDKLAVTLGARYFDNEDKVTSQTALPIWYWPNPVITSVNSDSDTLFKGNISYDLNDSQMFYATISEGYRRGGTNATPVRPDPDYPNDPEWNDFGSDTVLNYELGLKGRNDIMRYQISAFFVDWDDPQVNVATPSGAYYAVANGSAAETTGIESEISWILSDNLTLTGGYTYLDASLTEDLYLHDASEATDGKSELRATSGAQLPGTPDHMLNIALTHSMDLSADLYLVSRVSGYYQSDVENTVLNIDPNWDQTLDGFGLMNLSFTVVALDWSVTLSAKNIFNEKGQTAVYKEEYMTSDPSMHFYGTGQKDFITTPRTITLSASYNF